MGVYLGPIPGAPLPPSAFDLIQDGKPTPLKRFLCRIGWHETIYTHNTYRKFRLCYRCNKIEMEIKSKYPDNFYSVIDEPYWIQISKQEADYHEDEADQSFRRLAEAMMCNPPMSTVIPKAGSRPSFK